ncbi:hypothetical protein N9A38_01235 [Gammaproteobacteria bacterium]|nr:hypothetical protein [Gammaproteobacteria bacterium]
MNTFITLSDEELIDIYPNLIQELKKRGIISTKNVAGGFGEYYAHQTYKNNENLPDIELHSNNYPDVDAVCNETGKTYQIKSMSHNETGKFSNNQERFDFLIIVQFSDNYRRETMYELTWEEFLEYRTKKIVKGIDDGWVVRVTNMLKDKLKKVYP